MRNQQLELGRQLYTLAEAAELTGQSANSILRLGAGGGLPIYVRVPEDMLVYRTDAALLGGSQGTYSELLDRQLVQQFASGLRPRLLKDAAFLVVSSRSCQLVAAHGEAHQAVFEEAYRISEDLDLLLIDQPRTGVGLATTETECVACYSRGREPFVLGMQTDAQPTNVPFTTSTLRLRYSDLVKHGLVVGRSLPRFDNGFRYEAYMPRKVLELNDAAQRFWNRNSSDWTAPRNEEVTKWFIQGDRQWGVKAAQAATTILRDSFERWDQSAYERHRALVAEERKGKPSSFAPTGLSKFDAVVYVAQRWQNADLAQGERTEKLETYPDRTEMLNLLMNKYGFASYLAEAAWRIASPVHAVKRGRPRSAD